MEDYIGEIIKCIDKNQFKPLKDIVYEGIRKAIIRGIIPVGEKLNEKECAERMNISRTPIREALHRLEEEGLVEYIPKYGVIVRKISIEDAKEIYQIRRALDAVAAINAMNIMTNEQFKEMKDLLDRTKEANKSSENIHIVAKQFSEFNQMIYRFSKMPRLTHIVTRLSEYLVRFRDISLKEEGRRQKALEEHFMIYEAMLNKDEELVKKITNEHLEYSETYVIREMKIYQSGK